MNDDVAALEAFGGLTRLFPLPALVLFPGVVQGLQIYEPRYQQLMADTLAGDMLMSLVLLRPDSEEEPGKRPAIAPVGCLGRVAWYERLTDGRFNLQLRSLSRVRILHEVETDRLYRTARAELMPDVSELPPAKLTELRHMLAENMLPKFGGQARHQVQELFDGDQPLGPLCDVLSYALPLPLELKQWLLAEVRVEKRALTLIHALAPSAPASARKYPPEFSAN